jgi:hypothetical protein
MVQFPAAGSLDSVGSLAGGLLASAGRGADNRASREANDSARCRVACCCVARTGRFAVGRAGRITLGRRIAIRGRQAGRLADSVAGAVAEPGRGCWDFACRGRR